MANLTIEGQGSFTLNPEQMQGLLSWLEQNGVARTIKTEGSDYDGKTLLSEDNNQPPKSDPPKSGPPKSGPQGDGTYDFGTTWI